MLFSTELFEKLKHFENFEGVFARDELPENVNWPVGLIVNTDLRSKPGTHWVAIFIDENGKGEYFDSYGFQPKYIQFKNFLNNNCISYFYNTVSLQCHTCVTCGHYCIAFLMSRFVGMSFIDFIMLFTSDPHKNDIIIKQLFDTI